ncbi:MAG: response regulator [Candidatus Omnitrophica bacterium]|nr:response regulator [Candidatus Omnitrophota bacterium]
MSKRILVIDDEAMITLSLRKLLKKEGYEATIVSDGVEALEKIKTEEFDLLILDIRMPLLDGIETIKNAREIRGQQGKTLIPEILITGYADEEKYKNAVDLKVSGFLYKPFDTQELLAIIKNTLEK